MDHPLYLLLIFGIGIIAGTLNVLAAGGSLIVLPVLIFLGLSPTVANGTNRIAILVQNTTAVLGFKKHGLCELKTSFKLSVMTLPGSILGAYFAVGISDAWFKRILAAILVFGILGMIFPPKKKPNESATAEIHWFTYLVMFGVGFYGGFIQAGVGLIFMVVAYQLLKISLVRVNMHKVFIIAVYTLPALAIFALSGKVDWLVGVCLAAGNGIGGYLATKLAVRGGEKIIRIVIGIALLVLAIRLFMVM